MIAPSPYTMHRHKWHRPRSGPKKASTTTTTTTKLAHLITEMAKGGGGRRRIFQQKRASHNGLGEWRPRRMEGKPRADQCREWPPPSIILISPRIPTWPVSYENSHQLCGQYFAFRRPNGSAIFISGRLWERGMETRGDKSSPSHMQTLLYAKRLRISGPCVWDAVHWNKVNGKTNSVQRTVLPTLWGKTPFRFSRSMDI